MDIGDQLIGIRRDNRKCSNPFARRRLFPVLPNARKTEGGAILHGNCIGLLCLLSLNRLPLERRERQRSTHDWGAPRTGVAFQRQSTPLGENSSKLSLSYLSKLIMDQTKTSATRPIGPPRSSRRFVGKRGRTDQQPEFTRYVYPDDHQRLQVVLQSADASHAQQCCRRHHCGAEACSGGS